MRRIALALLLVLAWTDLCPAAGADDQLFYAVESLARGRYAQTADALSQLLVQDPDNAYAATLLGRSRACLGQTDPARDVLEKAVAARPDNLTALWLLGCLDLLDHHVQRAGARFAAMRQADPGNVRGVVGLGLAAAMVGQTRAAVRFLAEAQAGDSQDPLVRALTGLAYWRLGAPVNARLELEAALELDPRNVRVLDWLGLVYRRQGKTDLAANAWEQALAVSPTDAQARFYLSRQAQDEGLAACLADRPVEARRAYQRALALEPANEAAAAALSALGPAAPAATRSGP